MHHFHGLPSEQLCQYTSQIDPLSNPVILNSLHMAEPSEKTFITPFVHPFHHSAQLFIRAFGTLFILLIPITQQSSEVVHLYSPNLRPLLLLPYHCLSTIHKNKHEHVSCKTLARSTCKPLSCRRKPTYSSTKNVIEHARANLTPSFG